MRRSSPRIINSFIVLVSISNTCLTICHLPRLILACNCTICSVLPAAICSLTRPWEAILIGAVGALLACPGCALLERLRIDDPVGCVPTHGVAGIWGLLSVALFAEKDILENRFSNEFGIFKGGPWRFLGVQMLMVVAIAAWAAVSTFLELLLVDKILGLRMSVEHELLGADKVEHGIVEHELTTLGNYHAKENGREQGESVEINRNELQATEEVDALKTNVDTDKAFWKTVRTRRKLFRPKWRKAVSLKGTKNETISNGTFEMNSSHINCVSVNLEGVTECGNHTGTQENGNAISAQINNGFQAS